MQTPASSEAVKGIFRHTCSGGQFGKVEHVEGAVAGLQALNPHPRARRSLHQKQSSACCKERHVHTHELLTW